jgi:hypothetical protein
MVREHVSLERDDRECKEWMKIDSEKEFAPMYSRRATNAACTVES